MPLSPGTKLGPYEIQSALGAGGMGEVYRARDTRLDRQVAVKILAGHLSATPELKQRMEREARAISALNHPSICQLYDVGSQDGTDYLVMEFLEGDSLADRLRKGPLPLVEILKIGIAVADALAFAHHHGIVHRDLKPGNVMLTGSGAKLMDFGLAKPLGTTAPTPSGSSAPPSFTAAPTVSAASPLSPLTAAGSIVGTIQYMSPEQIEGREADARSDIFALGAVLYEMATGSRPFQGKSQISVASAILEKDPDPISAGKPQTLPAFEHIVSVCLAKNPDERFQTVQDVKLELQWIASGKSAASATPSTVAPPSFRRERFGWIAALIAVALLSAAGGNFLRPVHLPRIIRTAINPPEKTSMNLVGDAAGPPVLSPDGTRLAFAANGSESNSLIWIRAMDSTEAHSVPGTEGATFPFWSPESRSIGFFAGGKLKSVDLGGGAPQVICDASFGRGGAWGAGGTIVFSSDSNSPISRVSASGGTPAHLTTIEFNQHDSHRWPFFLPDGRHFLYLAINHDASKSASDTIYYASVDGRENRPLFHSTSNVIYAAGFLLFARSDQLMAQPFDAVKGTLSGEPQVIAKGVMNDFTTWHMDASASDDGLLLYASGGGSEVQIVAFDRAGKQTAVLAEKMANLLGAVFSPQGDRVALSIAPGVADIWVLDLARSVRTRLTFGSTSNVSPVWSPDGKWIAYSTVGGPNTNIVRRRSDGSGEEELLVSDQPQASPSCWSHDGKYIFYHRAASFAEGTWVVPLEGDRKPRRVLERGGNSTLSPDGHWLAYESSESGASEVYVTGFDGAQGKWQASLHGGMFAQWSGDGKEIYYMDLANNVFEVPVKYVGGALQFGAQRTLLTGANWNAPASFYNVSPDGKRILIPVAPQQVSQSVTVLSNFTSLLK